jgi:pSer/pThr/pTyr-binding forkhead associated (FHA) protein
VPEPQGPTARWRVSFDSGESFEVQGLTLVGRRPEPRSGEDAGQLVALRSDDMSLSKTHAQLQVVADGVLVVMDRGSTNGTVLLRQGVARDLAAGRPTTLLDGDHVRFGDRIMSVARES